ncbi:MAG: LacI family DNA-binding transcriptional regulator [Armatimonadota bacterium]
MATIRDVARHAGVSHQAVSAVINGKIGQVSEETRLRIMKTINEMGYRPNRVARQLATGKFNTIAICFERPERQEFWRASLLSIFSGVLDSAVVAGQLVLFVPTGTNHEFVDVLGNLPTYGVDGAVVVGPILTKKTTMEAIDSAAVPIVCIDSYADFHRASTVDMDSAMGIRAVAEHLISEGHSRIVYVGYPPSIQCWADRLKAFCEVAREHDIPVDENTIWTISPDNVVDCVHGIAKSKTRPTAIICGEGAFAPPLWKALTDNGIRIPEDIAIGTHANSLEGIMPNAHWEDITITIRDTPHKQGYVAVEMLTKLISNELSAPLTVKLPPEVKLVSFEKMDCVV